MISTEPGTDPATPTTPVDCGVVIVTYNSARDVVGLLDTLPAAAAGLTLRVVVVDNDSRDDIAARMAERPDVVFVPAGANLGYAAAINLGRRRLGDVRTVFVSNPDLQLRPNSLRRLVETLDDDRVGVAVPRMLEPDGTVSHSLRREPTLLRTLGEALFGDHWPSRPSWLAEMVRAERPYLVAHEVQWAVGAALLISARVDAAIGDWDAERFFMYCEETDFFRRVRDAGWTIRYQPDAAAIHRGGGSGGGTALGVFEVQSRLRYFRKYHGRLANAAFRLTLAVQHGLRARRPVDRAALRAVFGAR